MKTIITVLTLLTMTASAKADGFFCRGNSTGLDFRVLNHTHAAAGTRTPSVMVVSNPYIASDRKTIAVFKDENRTLSYLGRGNYEGKVDLRFSETGRKGENIAGTKLGELKTIILDIEFSYSHHDSSLANSVKEVPGKISYIKRTGEILEETARCTRYLKE